MKRRYLMADETPIQVLKEEGRRPQSKSYVWLVRTGDNGGIPIILYNYTPTRAGSHAAAFLAGADPGYYLMVDGYKGYNKVPEAALLLLGSHTTLLAAGNTQRPRKGLYTSGSPGIPIL